MSQILGLFASLAGAVGLIGMAYRPWGRKAVAVEPEPVPMLPAESPATPEPSPSAPLAVVAAPDDPIRYAFEECGLPLHKLRPDFDVAATGKLNEVIHHASIARGKAHPLRTVADIQALLQR